MQGKFQPDRKTTSGRLSTLVACVVLKDYVFVVCSAPRLAFQVAESLKFAPPLRLAAEAISKAVGSEFTSMHLRVETDMSGGDMPLATLQVTLYWCFVRWEVLCSL